MQLTAHSDFAFRTLIALACVAPEKLTAAQISEGYEISLNHLLKVVQKLSALGFVTTTRGQAGGIRLACDPETLSLGTVLRSMEPELGVVACLRQGDVPCAIAPACGLKSILREATQGFLAILDQHTLADAARSKTRLTTLLKLHSSR